jgi:hypothetical protein
MGDIMASFFVNFGEILYLVSNKKFRITHYLDYLHLEISEKKGGANK